jgi:hypothetical protein
VKKLFFILVASAFLLTIPFLLVLPLGATITYSPSTDGGVTCSGHPCMAAVTCPTSSCAATDIQTALNAVWLGDTITIQAGKVWTVNSTLTIYRKTVGAGYVTIRTSSDDSLLPAADARITPVYKALLPELRLTTDSVLLWVEQTKNAVEHYQFVGIWFSTQDGLDRTNDLVRLWDAVNHTDPSFTPNDIIFDRCLVLPAVTGSTKAGIRLGVRNGVVKNSYIDQIKSQADSATISFPNAPGPVAVTNNFLSAAGENILVGGLVPTIPNLSPLDIDFRHNIFYKDPAELKYETWPATSWVRAGKIINGGNGSAYIASASGTTGASSPAFPASVCSAPPVCSSGCCVTDGTVTWQKNFLGSSPKWTVKNSFEYKFMGRSVIQWNGIDGSWSDGQSGVGFSFKPESQCSRCWIPHTENLTVANNVIRNTERPFSFSGSGDDGGGVTGNWNVHDNLVWRTQNPANNTVFHSSNGLTFNHNTVDANQNMFWSGSAAPVLVFTNNLAQSGAYGFKANGIGVGMPSLLSLYAALTFTNNVLSGAGTFDSATVAGHYPTGNFGTAWSDVRFADSAHGDYSLSNSSPYKGAGTDGMDLGADTAQLPLIRHLSVTPTDRMASFTWAVTQPIQDIPCVIEASTDRDFATYIGDLDPSLSIRPDTTDNDRLPRAGLDRAILIGANSRLASDTTYWYRLHCGGAFEQGSFTTTAPLSGGITINIAEHERTRAAAYLDVEWGTSYSRSTDVLSGGGTIQVPCVFGHICRASFTVPAGLIVYYRLEDKDSGGHVLSTSPVSLRAGAPLSSQRAF